jgi:hypothetical protein
MYTVNCSVFLVLKNVFLTGKGKSILVRTENIDIVSIFLTYLIIKVIPSRTLIKFSHGEYYIKEKKQEQEKVQEEEQEKE